MKTKIEKAISTGNVEMLHRDELRVICRSLSMSVSGSKQQLVNRVSSVLGQRTEEKSEAQVCQPKLGTVAHKIWECFQKGITERKDIQDHIGTTVHYNQWNQLKKRYFVK